MSLERGNTTVAAQRARQDRAEKITKLPCDYGHPPECQFDKSETGLKFGDKCSVPHWKVEEQPNKKPKKGGDKCVVAVVKDVRQFGCVLQDTEPPESSSSLRKGTIVLGPIGRVRYTRATHCVKQTF